MYWKGSARKMSRTSSWTCSGGAGAPGARRENGLSGKSRAVQSWQWPRDVLLQGPRDVLSNGRGAFEITDFRDFALSVVVSVFLSLFLYLCL